MTCLRIGNLVPAERERKARHQQEVADCALRRKPYRTAGHTEMGTVLMMKKVNNKLKRLGAGEMAQHLTALTEDLSLVPRMHTRGLTTTWSSLFCLPRALKSRAHIHKIFLPGFSCPHRHHDSDFATSEYCALENTSRAFMNMDPLVEGFPSVR